MSVVATTIGCVFLASRVVVQEAKIHVEHNSMDMTCVGNVGSVGEAFNNNDVWKELWTCYVMRWEPKQDLDGKGAKADL